MAHHSLYRYFSFDVQLVRAEVQLQRVHYGRTRNCWSFLARLWRELGRRGCFEMPSHILQGERDM